MSPQIVTRIRAGGVRLAGPAGLELSDHRCSTARRSSAGRTIASTPEDQHAA